MQKEEYLPAESVVKMTACQCKMILRVCVYVCDILLLTTNREYILTWANYFLCQESFKQICKVRTSLPYGCVYQAN